MSTKIEPATGPAVWKGADFVNDDAWIVSLSSGDLSEIDTALNQAKRTGLPVHQITSKEFPLPGLGKQLEALAEELENGRGFAVIRGVPVNQYSEDENKIISWGLCSYFGTGIPQSRQGDWINHVMDISDQKSAPKPELDHVVQRKQLRTNHRGGELDFHTDTTDVFALFCLRPAKSGGTSRLVSAGTLHNMIGETKPDYLEALYDGYFYMSQSDDNVNKAVTISAKRVPVFTRKGDKVEGYYISQVVQRALDHGDFDYNAVEDDAREELQRVAETPGVAHEFDLQAGDLLVVNNHAVLHARYDYEEYPEIERRRHLFRLWMANTPEMMSKTFLAPSEKFS
ncbi:MAG: TauD/TfdA family dioxygenase [Alphaproteobacteria bacterium]